MNIIFSLGLLTKRTYKKQFYYDPTYDIQEVKKDKMTKFLEQAAKDKAAPKAIPFDDYKKSQKEKEALVQQLLGNPPKRNLPWLRNPALKNQLKDYYNKHILPGRLAKADKLYGNKLYYKG